MRYAGQITNDYDIVNKKYLDSRLAGLDTGVSDVTVAGTSVVSSGTAVVPKANTENVWGVVKVAVTSASGTLPSYTSIITGGGGPDRTLPLVTLDTTTRKVFQDYVPWAATNGVVGGVTLTTDPGQLNIRWGAPSSDTSNTVLSSVPVINRTTGTISNSKLPAATTTAKGAVILEDTLSTSSTNAVQNGVVATALAGKYDTSTSKKLTTTTIYGVTSNTTTASAVTRASQTTATGGWTAVTASSTDANSNGNPDANENLLANIRVSSGTLIIGAATLNTQTTYSVSSVSDVTVPVKNTSSTTVATGGLSDTSVTTNVGGTVVATVGVAA